MIAAERQSAPAALVVAIVEAEVRLESEAGRWKILVPARARRLFNVRVWSKPKVYVTLRRPVAPPQ